MHDIHLLLQFSIQHLMYPDRKLSYIFLLIFHLYVYQQHCFPSLGRCRLCLAAGRLHALYFEVPSRYLRTVCIFSYLRRAHHGGASPLPRWTVNCCLTFIITYRPSTEHKLFIFWFKTSFMVGGVPSNVGIVLFLIGSLSSVEWFSSYRFFSFYLLARLWIICS